MLVLSPLLDEAEKLPTHSQLIHPGILYGLNRNSDLQELPVGLYLSKEILVETVIRVNIQIDLKNKKRYKEEGDTFYFLFGVSEV